MLARSYSSISMGSFDDRPLAATTSGGGALTSCVGLACVLHVRDLPALPASGQGGGTLPAELAGLGQEPLKAGGTSPWELVLSAVLLGVGGFGILHACRSSGHCRALGKVLRSEEHPVS